MKVYNLACPVDHHFEGWFSSEKDFLAQQEQGILLCPICESAEITRMPSAPHIGKSSSIKETATSTDLVTVQSGGSELNPHTTGEVLALTGKDHSVLEAQVQAAFMKAMRGLMDRSEDVGESFAEEARKIHYKESPERSIRGQTTLDEAEALREEGIEVMAVPLIPALKNTLQ